MGTSEPLVYGHLATTNSPPREWLVVGEATSLGGELVVAR